MSEKIISITDAVKPKNLMSDADRITAESNAVSIMDRINKEKEDLRAQEVILDGTNTISFPGYPYKFTALGEKIIITIDVFKSGYECKVCGGKKKVESKCICEDTYRPGYKYSGTMLDAFSGFEGGIEARKEIKCTECQGDYVAARQEIICKACKGRGALIIFPKESEALPSTGTIVSIGALASKMMKEDGWEYKVGDKVLFGPHAGSFIPTKSGLLLKILDYNQAWLRIEGASDLNAFDFILNEKD